MKWIYKAIVQNAVSVLPLSHQINYLFQRCITVGKELHFDFVKDRLTHANNHIECFRKYGNTSLENASVLEIGTGWYPLVPIAFLLNGSDDIETIDIRQLYSTESINKTLRAILRLHENGLLRDILPNYQDCRIPKLKSALTETNLSEKLRLLQIKSTISECCNIAVASDSKDFIVSNNTIQLFQKEIVGCFFSELTRIGRSNSIMCHLIDLADEFSSIDSSITIYNFLKFSDFQWKMISSQLYSHNRLRYPDYRRFFSDGLKIIEEEVIRGNESDLRKFKIHKLFSKYSTADLLVSQVRFVAIINK